MPQKTSQGEGNTQYQSSGDASAREDPVTLIRFIGCCGAYCRTCGVLKEGVCKGCKLGYEQGERDITKAKCGMKVCCFKDRRLETCADCSDYAFCDKIRAFHLHKGHKYKKYKQSIEFIREKGYSAFLQCSEQWNGPYGKLD